MTLLGQKAGQDPTEALQSVTPDSPPSPSSQVDEARGSPTHSPNSKNSYANMLGNMSSARDKDSTDAHVVRAAVTKQDLGKQPLVLSLRKQVTPTASIQKDDRLLSHFSRDVVVPLNLMFHQAGAKATTDLLAAREEALKIQKEILSQTPEIDLGVHMKLV